MSLQSIHHLPRETPIGLKILDSQAEIMSKPLVLITGATGHLGFRTLAIALENGYRARVALRRLEQVEKLKKTASLQPYLDAVEFVQVPDITASEAYEEAIKGVDYVLHIASPIYSGLSPDEVRFNFDLANKIPV